MSARPRLFAAAIVVWTAVACARRAPEVRAETSRDLGGDAAAPPDAPLPSAARPSAAPSALAPTRIATFAEAKQELSRLYAAAAKNEELYCGCPFRGATIDLATCGYRVQHDAARAQRIEWEHVVPAHRFGGSLPEWAEGSSGCVDARGRRFRGRKCARRASEEFRRMEADMHNLFPVIGEVNGLRGDFPMDLVAGEPSQFGACPIQIEGRTFEPRPQVRGDLARAYLYMDAAYPSRVRLSAAERSRYEAWSAGDPPDDWERQRNALVARVFGRPNPFIR